VILESKENEIKELKNKLETISKEHEFCQKEAESNMDPLKCDKLQHVKSEGLLEEDNDDSCEIVELFSVPEKNTNGKKRKGKKIRSTVKKFNYQLKSSVQVNLLFAFK
jgi:hypothetical protein